jgi:hypothetical protein
MKTYLLLGALLCSHAHAAGEGYVNFVRQTQQSTGVVWSMAVSPEGAAASQGLLEEGGSLFQLWTIKQDTATEYLLDQKLVGAYMPSASVTVQTLDPYSHRPRTRADKPVTVTINVGGLISGPNIQDAAKRVLLEHHVKNYTGSVSSFTPAQATSGTPKSSVSIYNNGATVLNFATTSLTGSDPTKVSGEEHFVVHALADGSFTQSQIASANVQVWPVASGEIAGLKDGDRVRSKAPQLTVTMNDLYPRSGTYLQAYKGAVGPAVDPVRIVGAEKVLDQSTSLSDVLVVSDYDTAFPEDGEYTIELLTETPFGTERLDHVTFTVDRKLEVRGLLGGIEAE